jgi:polysaccharide biosynthesis protein PslJ
VSTQSAGAPSGPRWTLDAKTGFIVACSVLLAATVVVGRGAAPVAAMLILLSALLAWHRSILAWPVVICLFASSVLFVPVARYSLTIHLPLGLDFWQLAVMLVVLVWVAALLVDPAVRLRRTPLDGPIALIVAASLGSVVVNYGRVAPLASPVLKALITFVSFIALYYFITSVVTTAARLYLISQFIVSGVAVVAFFAIVEQRAGFNVFDHVGSILPVLQIDGGGGLVYRNGLIRATGSADHPIALGVLFAMVFPLGLAFAKSRSPVWWVPTSLILIGVLASTSRTAFLALATVGVALLWLRPGDIRPLLPLAIPMLIVIKIAAPGSIATLKDSFLPSSGQEGLIASQRQLAADPTLISGRANFRPRLVEGLHRPLLGQGLGTRQTGADNPLRNSPILDNQWLGTFLDIGLIGIAGWLWLIVRIDRRLGRIARTRGSPDGLLAAGFVASITGFAVAMLTYDSLAFIQEAVILWVVLALAAALVAVHPTTEDALTEPAA